MQVSQNMYKLAYPVTLPLQYILWHLTYNTYSATFLRYRKIVVIKAYQTLREKLEEWGFSKWKGGVGKVSF